MDTPSLVELAERLASLERENQWMKRLGGATIVALILVVALGTNAVRSPREVRAEKFVLTDPSGHPRAKLEMRQSGPAFGLLARDGRDQMLMSTGEDGSSTLEYYDGPHLRASLTNNGQLGSSLNLLDRNRRSKAELFVTPDGGSGLALHRYQRGVGLNMDQDGTSKLSFQGRLGEERAGLSVAPDGVAAPLGTGADSDAIGLAPVAGDHKRRSETQKANRESGTRGGIMGRRAFGAP